VSTRWTSILASLAPRYRGVFLPLALAGLLPLFAIDLCRADTTVWGEIDAAYSVWTLSGSPYHISGSARTAAGVTIQVQPGVVVDGGVFTGSLTATNATFSNTSLSGSITLVFSSMNGTSVTTSSGSISNCVFRGAGLAVQGSVPVSGTTVVGATGAGINTSSTGPITGCQVRSNGIGIQLSSVVPDLTGTTFDGNTNLDVRIWNGDYEGNLSLRAQDGVKKVEFLNDSGSYVTWKQGLLSLHGPITASGGYDQMLYVGNGGRLEADGVTFLNGVYANAQSNAVVVLSNCVMQTARHGLRLDNAWARLDNTTISSPSTTLWNGVTAGAGASLDMRNCVITNFKNGIVTASTNAVVRESQFFGTPNAVILNAGKAAITNCLFSSNTYCVIAYTGTTSCDVHQCAFVQCSYQAVYADGPVWTDARQNWWGHKTGPSSIATGLGAHVTDHVHYDPWLTNPPAFMSVSPVALDFGETETQLTFDVWNFGITNMDYQCATPAAWVSSIAPPSATSTNSADRHTHTVTINRSLLVPGTNTATLTVTSAQAINSPKTIQLRAVALPPGALCVIINPLGALDAGAMWTCTAASGWHSNGITVYGIPPGPTTVDFKDVIGWLRPSNIIVTIASAQTSSVTAFYQEVLDPWPFYLPLRGVNLAGLDFGDSRITATDVLNPEALITKLTNHTDPVSEYLWTHLSSETNVLLYTNVSWMRVDALVNALNAIVDGPNIYDDQRFAGIAKSSETTNRLQEFPPAMSRRLNRLLLHDAYTNELNNDHHLPGDFGTNYKTPTFCEVDYFVSRGMNVIRLPFLWERVQRSLNADLDPQELGRLQDLVNYATARGAHVILDPHNYARYNGNRIGTTDAPISAFAGLWSKLATHFMANDYVIFGLMNEPTQIETSVWKDAANAAIAAIRATGARNLILVPGAAWSGAATWCGPIDPTNGYSDLNSNVMQDIIDNVGPYAFEVHQYLDGHGGSTPYCVDSASAVGLLVAFTDWCRANHKNAFLGEFGGSANTQCCISLNAVLTYMCANSDVWLGWTYWAAGPDWGDYILSIEPSNFTNGICAQQASDRTQMAQVLRNFLPTPKHYTTIQSADHVQVRALDGYSYQVESSTNLASGSWQATGDPFTGTGSLTNVATGPATNSQQFYRIRIDRSP
jgi:aryl-phospho-beta-D-glucosidase BglC (GH1 family)